ncbi:hypothetical protein CAPTEDRAFT_190122 [Capitella teleta]|uniref:Uncharacterized protein n=1 Tax=Capitella teleta TaxID=283909 RepID=R7ULV6_CAPTE|nr:hypothetical protein CAPTEDRAFT_190122 [Capitella teleta]|eukprot:ELU07200.1 hypothetical protein CAPTEDRAFT_190122 [Capitella teleta]
MEETATVITLDGCWPSEASTTECLYEHKKFSHSVNSACATRLYNNANRFGDKMSKKQRETEAPCDCSGHQSSLWCRQAPCDCSQRLRGNPEKEEREMDKSKKVVHQEKKRNRRRKLGGLVKLSKMAEMLNERKPLRMENCHNCYF